MSGGVGGPLSTGGVTVVSVPEVSGGGWVGVESLPVVSGRPRSVFGPELSHAAALRRSAISARQERCCGILYVAQAPWVVNLPKGARWADRPGGI